MQTILEPPEINQLKQIQNLSHFMTSTHPSLSRFQRFLKKCRITTKQMKLPRNRFSREQDPALWKSYIEEICSTERSLPKYRDHWPIKVYFDLRVALYLDGKYTSCGQSPEPASPSKQSLPGSSPLSIITPSPPEPRLPPPRLHPPPSRSCLPPPEPHPTPPETPPKPKKAKAPAPVASHRVAPPKRRLFVGKPPPDMRESAVFRALTPSPPPLPPKPAPPSQVAGGDASEDELTAAPCSNLPWNPKIKNYARHPRIEVVHVRCYDCGRPLTHDFAGPTARMRALVNDDDDQFNILFEAGLVSDKHLEILLNWPPECWGWFLDRLSTSAFVRQALRTKILTAASSKTASEGGNLKPVRVKEVHFEEAVDPACACPPYKRKFPGVLQPTAEVEEKLTDPNESTELLFAAMNLGDNRALFDDIMDLIERDSERYILTFRPSKEQFEAVVKSIFKERILFERYENEWPIRFIIKRIARKMGNRPLDDHLSSSEIQEVLEAIQQKPRKGPPPPCLKSAPVSSVRISYTCPIHPGVDVGKVSPKIHQLLHTHGLAELLPVFASVGIREEAHLRQFCAFSDEEKYNVVDDCRQWGRPIDLNIFQRVALKVDFTMQAIGQLL